MKNIIKGILIAAISFGAASCSGFLDLTPPDRVSDKVIWENTQNAEYAVNYLYSYIYDVTASQSKVGMTEALTDQMKYGSYTYNSLCFIPSEFAYGNATTITANYVDAYMGYWSTWYDAIRLTNQSISELTKYGQMSEQDKTRLTAELRFIRAFLYFDLVKRYKEVIIYNENMEEITKDKALSTEDQGWDFIQADLEFAAENLPDRTSAAGRLSKGAAWAMLSRTMLYAERWSAVKTAAEKVEELGYGLMSDYASSYQVTAAEGNNEIILEYLFDRNNKATHSFDFYYTPGGDYYAEGETGGGYGTPTQEMVESYELATGGYPDWSAWHETTTENPPYELLEPRFKATILYNQANWKGRKIEPFVNGTDGWCQWNIEREPMGRSTTGYYLRKLVDESHNVIKESGSAQPVPVIRYAEVLLNKAEACYHLGGDNIDEANKAIKAIRGRVKLPYTDKTDADLWTAIRNERKIELAYEGHWYWDLRRWGVAHKAYPEGLSGYQLHGLKITKGEDDTFTYEYVSVDDTERNFSEKLYRFPMPTSELSSNKLVDQYPEWK